MGKPQKSQKHVDITEIKTDEDELVKREKEESDVTIVYDADDEDCVIVSENNLNNLREDHESDDDCIIDEDNSSIPHNKTDNSHLEESPIPKKHILDKIGDLLLEEVQLQINKQTEKPPSGVNSVRKNLIEKLLNIEKEKITTRPKQKNYIQQASLKNSKPRIPNVRTLEKDENIPKDKVASDHDPLQNFQKYLQSHFAKFFISNVASSSEDCSSGFSSSDTECQPEKKPNVEKVKAPKRRVRKSNGTKRAKKKPKVPKDFESAITTYQIINDFVQGLMDPKVEPSNLAVILGQKFAVDFADVLRQKFSR